MIILVCPNWGSDPQNAIVDRSVDLDAASQLVEYNRQETCVTGRDVDPQMLRDWTAARCTVRGLPMPVADRGGIRVDVNSDTEIARWAFAKTVSGLHELGQSIDQPGYFLKLCGSGDELMAALPERWELQPPGYLMLAGKDIGDRPLPEGFRTEAAWDGSVLRIQIKTEAGEIAAQGYAVETPEVSIYDRIVTEPHHRRRGLGAALIQSLRGALSASGKPEVLVATEDGKALYLALGWTILSPFSTATIPADN